MDYINKEFLIFITEKVNNIEFMIFLIISIVSWVIKKNVTDRIEQSKEFFISSYNEDLSRLNEINSMLIFLSLEPENNKKSKKLFKLLVKNIHLIEFEDMNKFLNNIYENYHNGKPINERLYFKFLEKIGEIIKEKNKIIETHKQEYVYSNTHYIKFYSKKITLSLVWILSILALLYIVKYFVQVFV